VEFADREPNHIAESIDLERDYGSGQMTQFFAAYLNCAASVDLNCPTAWKEEDGFLLPSSGFRM
jgi:hypothetical protein